MRYKEHLAIGQYEFIEIEAETLEVLVMFREEYLKSREKPTDLEAANREFALASEGKGTNGYEAPTPTLPKNSGSTTSPVPKEK